MKSGAGGQWKSGHIYEQCLQEGSGRVDTDIWTVLTREQWRSGHRYMKSGRGGQWKSGHRKMKSATGGRWKSGHRYMKSGTAGQWKSGHRHTKRGHGYMKSANRGTKKSSCYIKTTVLQETSTDDIHPSTGQPNYYSVLCTFISSQLPIGALHSLASCWRNITSKLLLFKWQSTHSSRTSCEMWSFITTAKKITQFPLGITTDPTLISWHDCYYSILGQQTSHLISKTLKKPLKCRNVILSDKCCYSLPIDWHKLHNTAHSTAFAHGA